MKKQVSKEFYPVRDVLKMLNMNELVPTPKAYSARGRAVFVTMLVHLDFDFVRN